jgi:ABC-type sulfate/molybdate transport systems ATPase subunit
MRAEHLADRDAGALSGGERRRVHLARAVAIEPDVLLLDEPFAGLDAATRADLLHDAAAAFRAGVAATVVVVHDRAEAWALADRLVVLLDGTIAAQGAPRELLERPPTVPVARFLGFDGALSGSDGVLLTRPANVTIDPAGDTPATVGRLIPLEDGVRVQLETERGTVFALADVPGLAVGDRVALRVTGGMHYPHAAPENAS